MVDLAPSPRQSGNSHSCGSCNSGQHGSELHECSPLVNRCEELANADQNCSELFLGWCLGCVIRHPQGMIRKAGGPQKLLEDSITRSTGIGGDRLCRGRPRCERAAPTSIRAAGCGQLPHRPAGATARQPASSSGPDAGAVSSRSAVRKTVRAWITRPPGAAPLTPLGNPTPRGGAVSGLPLRFRRPWNCRHALYPYG